MALWVNRNLAGRGFLRMAYFTPTVLPMVAVANIWLFFYTPQYGLIAQVMQLFGAPGPNWLGDRATALPALMLVTVWKEAGFFMIFYLAALQTVCRCCARRPCWKARRAGSISGACCGRCSCPPRCSC